MADLLTTSDAILSPCQKHRYKLTRTWGLEPALPFVMLNPSTADASADDPTIRRCSRFARDRGYGGIIVVNLFSFRATSPSDMRAELYPNDAFADAYLNEVLRCSARAGVPVVAAWGANGSHQNRDKMVMSFARLAGCDMICLGTTKDGHPRHPLYVKADQPFKPFPAQGIEAGTAETGTGSVHESPVAESDAPQTSEDNHGQ